VSKTLVSIFTQYDALLYTHQYGESRQLLHEEVSSDFKETTKTGMAETVIHHTFRSKIPFVSGHATYVLWVYKILFVKAKIKK
jgi:hypothetical protein